jgi:undecaprenyl-diphosphatase
LTVPLLFDVTLHLGTLIVTLLFFRKDVKNILIALGKGDFKSENGKLIPLIAVGTLPTALIGLVFGNVMDAYFSGFLALGGGFIAGGVALYWSKFGKERKNDITYINALLIGTAQGLAIIPSLSRSGMTITVALLLGINREKSFKFSFLLSIPAVVGALGLTFYEQRDLLTLAGIGLTEISVGILVTILLSFLALTLLRRTLAKRKFHLFAFYCLILGALLIALSLS